MSANVTNTVPFLRTSREYPVDSVGKLSSTLSKTYIDVAAAVNERTIGIYTINRPSITGNNYFFTAKKQQTLRQVYTFTTTADIQLGFKLAKIFKVVKAYGVYESGTSVFGLIFGTSVAIPGQISFFLVTDAGSTTSDLIRFVVGAGAPAIDSGRLVIEWVSDP